MKFRYCAQPFCADYKWVWKTKSEQFDKMTCHRSISSIDNIIGLLLKGMWLKIQFLTFKVEEGRGIINFYYFCCELQADHEIEMLLLAFIKVRQVRIRTSKIYFDKDFCNDDKHCKYHFIWYDPNDELRNGFSCCFLYIYFVFSQNF